jgi:hypothetical protein
VLWRIDVKSVNQDVRIDNSRLNRRHRRCPAGGSCRTPLGAIWTTQR